MDCMNCNEPIKDSEGPRKRIYCDDKCRKAYKRKLAKLAAQSGQKAKTDKPDIQSGQKGICKYCGAKIDSRLVCCGPCAWSRPANYGNSTRFTYEPHFTGTMTDYEREHYKPASELGPGEYNPVSKPGDEHYKVAG